MNYGRFAAVVRIIKCNDSIGNFGERDSKKKPRSRTESSVKNTILHYQRITILRARAGNDSVNGLIRRARNLILSISSLIRMSIPYVKVISVITPLNALLRRKKRYILWIVWKLNTFTGKVF